MKITWIFVRKTICIKIEIRNYIGSRNHLVVQMLHGCTVERSEEKDTIIIQGIDLDNVSQSAASIQQICFMICARSLLWEATVSKSNNVA